MKHPFQLIALDSYGELLYVAVKQTLQIFDLRSKKLVKTWSDELDHTFILAKQQQEKIEKLKAEKGVVEKVPKIPTPGATAPKINNFIRNLLVTETHVVITTDTDKACVIFEIDPVEYVKLVKRVELPKRPCSVIVDARRENVILGDKFGDVYKISLTKAEEDELVPILGHVSMLTSLNKFVKDGKEYVVTTDRDEHIKISNYPKAYIIETFLFEHLNFISTTLITHDLKMCTGGGDDFLCYWDLQSNELIRKVDLRRTFPTTDEFIVLKIVQFQSWFVVVLEKSSQLAILNGNFDVVTLLQCDANVVDLFANDEQIIVSLENASLQFITKDGADGEFLISTDLDLIGQSEVEVATEQDIIPLFNVGNLRKYSEKYT